MGTIEREPEVIDNLTSTSTIDALSANQGKELNEKITNTPLEYITGYNEKDVAANTTTTIVTITFPSSGKWLVLSNMDRNTTGSSTYNHTLNGITVRSPDYNGGGSVNFAVVDSSSTTISGWSSTATRLRVRYTAIRISRN